MARIKYYNTTNNAWEYADATGISQSTADGRYLGISASAVSAAKLDSNAGDSNTPVYFSNGKPVACTALDLNTTGSSGSCTGNAASATQIYSSASTTKAYVLGTTTASSANHATVYNASVYTSGSVLYGAAWNDYAEYRETTEMIEPGRVVCENNNDTLSLSQERLQPGAEIVSDTFGFAIGETEQCKTPIAAAGRVLAYPYEDRNTYNAGDPVCAGPNGTISKMTREEVREYPDRMIGTVSAVPTYETWGENNVPVNGRIWIRIK